MAVSGEDSSRRELRFRCLYQAHFSAVQAYAMNRLGPVDEVADVVAEVFLTAWRRLADIPPPPADRLWLYGTARRVISRRYRTARRLDSLFRRIAAQHRPQEQPLTWVRDPAHGRLLSAISTLKPADREALLLVYWEQLTHAEAAETLGCSVNAIGIRVHKAKTRLRQILAAQAGAEPAVPAIIQPNGAGHGS